MENQLEQTNTFESIYNETLLQEPTEHGSLQAISRYWLLSTRQGWRTWGVEGAIAPPLCKVNGGAVPPTFHSLLL